MVVKRRSFAQARKAAGYTQESLAERLGVDRTTVARWEAGEYQPQPWQRPRLAEAFGVSLCDFNQLLSDAGTMGYAVEVSAAPAETAAVPDDARTFLNELATTVSVSGVTWEEFMRWLSRREVLKHGVAATVLPVLGLDGATATGAPGYAVAEPSVLAALSCVSWASPIYEAVLNPTDAARCAASELEANREGHLGSPADLRRAAATVMQASLSSDYTQLAQSLPRLVGQIELANLQARDDDRLHVQRLLSDVYAIAGWTLIKADSPVAVCAVELHEERCDFGTVFGPTNVAIHQVAVAVELGDASEAMRHIPKVRLDRMSGQLTERRARFLIDVSRSYVQLRDDTAALDALLQAEAIAPDELRNHRLTHDVLRELLPRERRSSGLHALATRCKQLH